MGRSIKNNDTLFPYPGGKSGVADQVWSALGHVKHYIEPFCGSAAVLFKNPHETQLEVINDINFYVANFWRALKHQPEALYREQDYPISQIDMDARHRHLTESKIVEKLRADLLDPLWPGNAKLAGWWVWGQCAAINRWCKTEGPYGSIPSLGNGGRGMWRLSWRKKDVKKHILNVARRLRNVRILHGNWARCLNLNYGTNDEGSVGVFLDPPYKGFEFMYSEIEYVASEVEAWCRSVEDNPQVRIVLCGHVGDYELPGWSTKRWKRNSSTFAGSTKTQDRECLWFSPHCLKPKTLKSPWAGRQRQKRKTK